ncbi:MAG: sigma-E processing peptidase SpoIIGA [Clostridia bacterium]
MTLSIELFLLDNLMMNYLTLRLAGVLFGGKTRQLNIALASALGAVYALLSMTCAPFLSWMAPKLLLGAAMALPLAVPMRLYPKALFCLLISACLMGGIMFGLTLLLGGSFSGGAYICTVPIRVALLSAVAGALLPRGILAIMHAVKQRTGRVRLRIQLKDRLLELTALIDSGNLLVEPLTGKSVIIVRPGLLPECHGWPIPYRTVDGEGILNAMLPIQICVLIAGQWRTLDAFVATSQNMFYAADAIIGSDLIMDERWETHAENTGNAPTAVQKNTKLETTGDPLYSFGGDTAPTISSGAGTAVD